MPFGTLFYYWDAAAPATTYGYDANDRLLADAYDANGNTVLSGGTAYVYDFEDRLIDYNAGEVVNVYDADGNRVLRTRGASTTAYLIDEMNPTGYAQVVEEITGGTVTATYALGELRTHQTRWESGTPALSYYGYDAHGNVRLLADSNRVVTDRFEYDAFWEPVERQWHNLQLVLLHRRAARPDDEPLQPAGEMVRAAGGQVCGRGA
jgi:hypothetical protein